MKITFISDTHNKHNHLTSNAYNNILGSGDVLCINVTSEFRFSKPTILK